MATYRARPLRLINLRARARRAALFMLTLCAAALAVGFVIAIVLCLMWKVLV